LEIKVRKVKKDDLKELWEISYGDKADLKWTEFDGPYFQDPILSWEEYQTGFGAGLVNNPHRSLIEVDGKIIGLLGAFWQDSPMNYWLEIGIGIYDVNYWSKGIGKQALTEWMDYLFELYPRIERVGFTTWSGNPGMMKLGQKIGMKEEAVIRKVRFWKDKYWDSVKYGVLREEWDSKS